MRLFIDEPFKWALSINAEVVLNLPASRVFHCLTDVTYQQRWLAGTLKGTSDQQLELGSIFSIIHGSDPYETKVVYEVQEFVPDQRLAYDGGQLLACTRRSFDVRSVPRGTEVRYSERHLHFGPFLALIWLLFLPVMIPALIVLQPPIRLFRQWRARVKLRRIEDWESSPEQE